MTPTGFAITYTRNGEERWLIRPGRGCTVVDELVVCRTRREANDYRRQLLTRPGITDARVWTLEETRERVEEAFARLPGQMYEAAAATLAS